MLFIMNFHALGILPKFLQVLVKIIVSNIRFTEDRKISLREQCLLSTYFYANKITCLLSV